MVFVLLFCVLGRCSESVEFEQHAYDVLYIVVVLRVESVQNVVFSQNFGIFFLSGFVSSHFICVRFFSLYFTFIFCCVCVYVWMSDLLYVFCVCFVLPAVSLFVYVFVYVLAVYLVAIT